MTIKSKSNAERDKYKIPVSDKKEEQEEDK